MEPQKGIKTFRQMSKHVQGPRNGEISLKDGVAYGKGRSPEEPIRFELQVVSHLDEYGVFRESGGEHNHWSDWSVTLYIQKDSSFSVRLDSSKYTRRDDAAADPEVDKIVSNFEDLDDSAANYESAEISNCIIKGAWACSTSDQRLTLTACNGHTWTRRDTTPREEDWPCDDKFTLGCKVDDTSGRLLAVEGLREAFQRFLVM